MRGHFGRRSRSLLAEQRKQAALTRVEVAQLGGLVGGGLRSGTGCRHAHFRKSVRHAGAEKVDETCDIACRAAIVVIMRADAERGVISGKVAGVIFVE